MRRSKSCNGRAMEGVITEDVVRLRRSIGAPGMAVLQFGFGSDAENPHLPHNHEQNQVVYTGTHDNDTVFISACV
ncbi:UNVERIFIED_CONTAM: 4-alpha-glucanotransferase, chloroplastic/amyloplastic, partial [Sesamum angustifolium]